MKIGIVGCGAIGSSLAKAVIRNFPTQTKLAALYDIDILKAKRLSKTVYRNKDLSVNSLRKLINKSELVIECACARSSWDIARNVLKNGRDIVIMSVGGIVNHSKELFNLADRHDSHVYIPSGAISGIDALKAARAGKVKEVILTTYKNPVSFEGVDYVKALQIKLDKLRNNRVLFSGSASKAVRCFPQNINVAAVLSLAGVGRDKTKVRIIACPRTKKNIHEIQVISKAGNIFTRTENILHPDNPKTSYLAVLSAIATLKQILEPIKIGT